MRLRFMLLAQYAFAHADGGMYVTGGGIEVLQVPTVPAVEDQLSLAVGVAFGPTECDRDHILEIRSFTPRETEFLRSTRVPVRPLSDSQYPGAEVPFQFVLNMRDLPFLVGGHYRFVLVYDGHECTSTGLTIRALRADTVRAPDAQVGLQQGYEAYQRGDTDQAEQIFADIVARFPTLGAAHNNLAFIYLAKGRAEEALAGFRLAGELGHDRHLVDFNVACCNYLLGRFAESLAGFQHCLRSYALIGTATLFGIVDGSLFAAWLSMPGDYVALASLNAAWCAWQMGDSLRASAFVGAVESTTWGESVGSGLVATPYLTAQSAMARFVSTPA